MLLQKSDAPSIEDKFSIENKASDIQTTLIAPSTTAALDTHQQVLILMSDQTTPYVFEKKILFAQQKEKHIWNYAFKLCFSR